jgi:bacterioferritin-associated ferredoxin
MIICSCNVLSDKQVRNALAGANPPRTPAQVHRKLGCKPQCGRCICAMREIFDEAKAESPAQEPSAKVA